MIKLTKVSFRVSKLFRVFELKKKGKMYMYFEPDCNTFYNTSKKFSIFKKKQKQFNKLYEVFRISFVCFDFKLYNV